MSTDNNLPSETATGHNTGGDIGGEQVTLSGPPEPVVNSDGDVKICYPSDDGTVIKSTQLGAFICKRCGVETDGVVSDGGIDEPHECDGCERQGPFMHAGELSPTEAQVAMKAETAWYPPSGVDDGGFLELWDDVEEYIRDHWDAKEPEIYAGLTAYALSTWLRPNLPFVPHLMLMGKTTGGKTRLLNTLARVSYRGVVSASATPASLFRMVDAWDVSFFVSEYHGLDHDSRRELDNVVRAGQKRGEIVTRAAKTNNGHEPETYDPFSHIAIATQYTPEDDIVNRCIQVHSSPTNRDMPPEHDDDRATKIRDRLLYARYRLLNSDEWEETVSDAYAYLAARDIKDRPREKLLPLVSVAIRWARLDEKFGAFVELVQKQDAEAAANSTDALVVEAIRDLAIERIGDTVVLGDGDPFAAVEIPYSNITDQYEDITGIERNGSWLGHVRSRLDLEAERKRNGHVITDPELGPKLRRLCDDHNLEWPDEEEDNSSAGDLDGVDETIASESQQVENYVKTRCPTGKSIDSNQLARQLNVNTDAADHGLEKLLQQGEVQKDGDGYLVL